MGSSKIEIPRILPKVLLEDLELCVLTKILNSSYKSRSAERAPPFQLAHSEQPSSSPAAHRQRARTELRSKRRDSRPSPNNLTW